MKKKKQNGKDDNNKSVVYDTSIYKIKMVEDVKTTFVIINNANI